MKIIYYTTLLVMIFTLLGCQSMPNDGYLYQSNEADDSVETEDQITSPQKIKKKKKSNSEVQEEPLNDSVIQEDSILKINDQKQKKKNKKKKRKIRRNRDNEVLDDALERDPIEDFE